MIDSKRLAVSLLGSVRAWVEPAFKSIGERIDSLEGRIASIPAGPQGERGQDGISGKDGAPGPQGERGQDGKDAEPIHPDTIARMVSDSVRLAVKEIPVPRDGKDGEHGRDADPVLIEKLVQANVLSAVAALPVPKDGADGRDGKNGLDADPVFIRSQIMAIVESIPPPSDGKDGAPGRDGRDADPDFIRAEIARVVESLPKPRDGRDADSEIVAASITAAVQPVAHEFIELADELLRSLEDDAALPIAPPSLNVNIDGRKVSGKSSGLSAREQSAIGNLIASTIRDTLMLPVKPVYDDSGKLLYGQRVQSAE